MKKLLSILLVLCTATFAQKAKLIISVSGELGIDVADVLMDGISYGLKNNDNYQILINDRQFKETLKKEWKKGNISDDRIIALAQNAGADYLCFTKIKSVKGLKGKQVTAQVYDLATMSYTDQIGMKTIDSDFSDLKHLTEIILDVVDDMLGTSNESYESNYPSYSYSSESYENDYYSSPSTSTNSYYNYPKTPTKSNKSYSTTSNRSYSSESYNSGYSITESTLWQYGELGWQYIWDMHHFRLAGGPIYGTMGLSVHEYVDEYGISGEDIDYEWIVGVIYRWIWENRRKGEVSLGFGLFGGLGARHVEGLDASMRHELGAEFILEIFSLYIAERNFHRIGGGIGFIFK